MDNRSYHNLYLDLSRYPPHQSFGHCHCMAEGADKSTFDWLDSGAVFECATEFYRKTSFSEKAHAKKNKTAATYRYIPIVGFRHRNTHWSGFPCHTGIS